MLEAHQEKRGRGRHPRRQGHQRHVDGESANPVRGGAMAGDDPSCVDRQGHDAGNGDGSPQKSLDR